MNKTYCDECGKEVFLKGNTIQTDLLVGGTPFTLQVRYGKLKDTSVHNICWPSVDLCSSCLTTMVTDMLKEMK